MTNNMSRFIYRHAGIWYKFNFWKLSTRKHLTVAVKTKGRTKLVNCGPPPGPPVDPFPLWLSSWAGRPLPFSSWTWRPLEFLPNPTGSFLRDRKNRGCCFTLNVSTSCDLFDLLNKFALLWRLWYCRDCPFLASVLKVQRSKYTILNLLI